MKTQHDSVIPSPKASVGNLESLAGLAEDLSSATLATAGEDLEALVRQRFGPDTKVSDVMDAMEEMRALSEG